MIKTLVKESRTVHSTENLREAEELGTEEAGIRPEEGLSTIRIVSLAFFFLRKLLLKMEHKSHDWRGELLGQPWTTFKGRCFFPFKGLRTGRNICLGSSWSTLISKTINWNISLNLFLSKQFISLCFTLVNILLFFNLVKNNVSGRDCARFDKTNF